MKLIIKFGLIIISASLILIALFQSNNLIYGYKQLKGQLNIIWNAKPIEVVMADPQIADSVKNKLILIQEIKAYAIDSLGIKPSENYSSYFDQQGNPLMFVLTAAEPYVLKSYNWKFPFLGSFSYKGFFDKSLAQNEQKKLAYLGYDTDLGVAGAWSTLGWFKDPILSSMLKKSEGELASLIIHELTHGTLYVKDSVQFNENLASFIGDKGAAAFLGYKFGSSSIQLKSFLELKADQELYINYVLNGASKLDSLYSTFKTSYSNQLKDSLKNEEIKSIVKNISKVSFNNSNKYQSLIRFALSEKNAFFMSYLRYRSEQAFFEIELENHHGNLRQYLNHLKSVHESL